MSQRDRYKCCNVAYFPSEMESVKITLRQSNDNIFFHHVDMCVNEDFWLQRVLTVCSYNYSTETYKLIQLRLQQCKNNNIHFSENNLVSFEL